MTESFGAGCFGAGAAAFGAGFGGEGSGTDGQSGVYEQWALRLRAWAKDPTTSLDGLPALDEDTFGQDTYLRLMRHLHEALAAFMESWNEQLTRAIASAHSKHELGTKLVRLRRLLEPRVRLANLPLWPPQIRDALRSALRSDLESIQQQLEEAICASADGGRFERAAQDGLVGVLRENRLTALLENEPRLADATSPVHGTPQTDGGQGPQMPASTSARSTRARRLIL